MLHVSLSFIISFILSTCIQNPRHVAEVFFYLLDYESETSS